MAPIQREKPFVLIVDDEVNTTIMLQYIFEREGYIVECITDGELAVDAARTLLPDLILLDIMLPRMGGFEILRHLKADALTEFIPTILITANAREPADVVHGLTLGADDYLYKPFAPQELLARIHSKLRARQLEESLRRRTRELESLLAASERLNQLVQREQLAEVAVELIKAFFPGDVVIAQLVDQPGSRIQSVWTRDDDLVHSADNSLVDDWLAADEPARLWKLGEAPSHPLFAVLSSNGIIVAVRQHPHILGVLIVQSRTELYTQAQVRLLEALGRQLAMAVRNAQLYELQNAYAQELETTVKIRSEELIAANRLLIRNEKLASIGHLAASIAHEINNPLMPIVLLLEQLEETLRAANVPIDLQDLVIVRENLQRIQRIVRSLLDFSRQETGLRRLDISQSLDAMEKLNRHSFQMERKTIEYQIEPSLTIYGSKDQLDAVFMNLILNARAALSIHGRLMIGAFSTESDVVISFSDDGSGIAPKNLDRIFDPFFSTKQQGTGLGLFVSYSVIEAHQGTISVQSEMAVGTTFTIRLPRWRDDKASDTHTIARDADLETHNDQTVSEV
ncbi:MAG: response regulator [Chloroflexota bacterium]|nr:response regulator [Chloroflexota bacterium]